MAMPVGMRTAFKRCCLVSYGASTVWSQHLERLRPSVRQMSEYYPIQDDVYGLTDDQKQVTYGVLFCFGRKCM